VQLEDIASAPVHGTAVFLHNTSGQRSTLLPLALLHFVHALLHCCEQVQPVPKRTMMRSAVHEVLSSPSNTQGAENRDPLRQRTHQLVLGRDIELQVISECIVKAARGGGGGVVVLEVCLPSYL
jgi:hypothetical protein